MSYKVSAIIIEDFYENPDEVREFALKSKWLNAKESYGAHVDEHWASTTPSEKYITEENISNFEKILNIKIDMDHFFADHKFGGSGWNAIFHVKMESPDYCQKGIHQHVTDLLNSPRKPDSSNLGYSAIVNLTPNHLSLKDNGQDIWKSTMGLEWHNSMELVGEDWPMTAICVDKESSAPTKTADEQWELLMRLQYRYNTALIAPADVWHAGSNGWGDSIDNGRMIQTFFFREE